MYADYHVHTEFSDDSRETMESQIETAIRLKLEEICFTDHVDYGVKKDWDEGNIAWRTVETAADTFRRDPITNVNYPEYFAKLMRMKESYKGRIRIKQGLEFGIQTGTVAQFEKLFDKYDSQLDFVLLSVHQVDNQEFWLQDYQQGKSQKEYNEGYYKEILAVMQQYKDYSVLAHLDMIIRYDLNGIYPFEAIRDIIAEILKTAIADGKGIEINTSGWRYGFSEANPSREILSLYKDLGGKIVTLGSDAHRAKDLAYQIKQAQKMLKEEIGMNEICTFDRMTPVFHPL